MIDLFLLEPEKIYGIAANDVMKQQKIQKCLNSGDYVASLKKDGQYHRYVKMNGEAKIQTRGKSVKTGTFGEVQDKVPHIFDALNAAVPDNSLLIGELYRPDWTTNEVGSILRCLPAKAIKRQEKTPLIFYIHDVWYWNGINWMTESKVDRVQFLKEIKKQLEAHMATDYIEFATYVDTVPAIHDMLDYAMENDEEGIVLTLKNSIVNPGARTAWKTLKIKKELQNDVDVFLTGNYKDPTMAYTGKEIENWEYWVNEKTGEKINGKYYKAYLDGETIAPVTKPFYYGWPGSVEIAVLKDNEILPIGWISGLSDEIKEDFATNRNLYINKICRVNAMETTEDYKLRHGKFLGFRDDITIEDCTFEKIFEGK